MPEEQQIHRRSRRLSTPMAIIIAGGLIAIALYAGLAAKKEQSAAAPGQPAAPKVNIKDVKISPDDPYIGSKNAKVTLVYWSDYQCPFCKAVEVGGIPQIKLTPAIPTLIKDYVDTGKLMIVYKDYPFLGNDSITAAMYEHAVWETYPASFKDWRHAMMTAQDQEGDQGFGNEESILKLSATIPGIDANKLKSVVAANKDRYQKLIDEDKTEGTLFGISGTPGFITGTTLIPGAVELAQFTSAIDAQLK